MKGKFHTGRNYNSQGSKTSEPFFDRSLELRRGTRLILEPHPLWDQIMTASCQKKDDWPYEQQINGRTKGSDNTSLEGDILIVCEAGLAGDACDQKNDSRYMCHSQLVRNMGESVKYKRNECIWWRPSNDRIVSGRQLVIPFVGVWNCILTSLLLAFSPGFLAIPNGVQQRSRIRQPGIGKCAGELGGHIPLFDWFLPSPVCFALF